VVASFGRQANLEGGAASEMTDYTFDYEDYYDNAQERYLSILITEDSGNKFSSPIMASPNFDGYIPITTASLAVRDVQPGYYIEVESSEGIKEFYPVMYVLRSEPLVGEDDQCDIKYLRDNSLETLTYAPTTSSVVVRYEDWNSKALGSSGWTISPQGNAIFTNIAARGRIEALSGYIGNSINGWEIGANLLSNASVGFYAPSVITGEVAIFAGAPYASRASAAFRVGYDGSLNASSATITGNLTATTLDVGGPNGIVYNGSTVTIGSSVTINAPVTVNSLQVGASPTLLKISDDVNGTNDGIYVNDNNYWYSDGQFSVGGSANNAVWSGSILTITGTINATNITSSVGNIAGFELAKSQLSTASVVVSSSGGFRLGNPTVFSVDQYGNLVAQNASVTGRINATSGSFSGDITAAAGRFTGSVSIDSSGLLYVGNLASQRVVMTSSGIFAFHQNGLEAFALPVSGSPRIGAFKIIPTGIVTQSASNANMILGDVGGDGSASSGIVLRGYRSDSASIAIYTIQNGTPTTYDSGDGFYVDENARLKLKGATGSLAFDGNDLYISGNINARSGQFTGSISAQYIVASAGSVGGWSLSASMLTGTNASVVNTGDIILGTGQSVARLSSSEANFRIWTGSATASVAPFRVTTTGGLVATTASITGNITANSGQFTGSVSAQHITASVGNVGGFVLTASSIVDTANTASTVGITTGNTSFFAGADDQLGTNAKFYVTQTGSVYAQAASITGDITATTIRATSASLNGNLLIFGSGTLYASDTADVSGQRVIVDKTGVTGYSPVGEQSFYLASGSASLITDGGFELQGAAGTALGGIWSTFWGNASVVVEGTTVIGGSKAARVAARTAGADFLQALNTSYGTTPGTKYNISAYVYSASTLSANDGLVEIWVLESYASSYPSYFSSSAALRVVTPATYLPARTWTKISGTYVSASPYTTVSLRTYSKTSSAFVIWDSVEISTGQNISNIAGFSFNEDSMFSNYVSIGNQGRAIFGAPVSSTSSSISSSVSNTSDFLTIDGVDNTYRMWIGNSNPSTAYFSVKKDGTVNLNSGGDLALYSASQAAIGGAASVISKINFYRQNTTSPAGQVAFFPSSSAMKIGSYTSGAGAAIGRVLVDTIVGGVAYSGSVELGGTVYGNGTSGTFVTGYDLDVNGSGVIDSRLDVNGIGITGGGLIRASSTGSVTYGMSSTSTHSSYAGESFTARVNRAANIAYTFFTGYSSAASAAPDLEVTLRGNGTVLADGAYSSPAADYAEYFEWADGNVNNENRVGYPVVLSQDAKIEIATENSESIIGIVSARPTVVGDNAWSRWKYKYLTNDFGEYIMEEYVTEDGVVQERRKLNPEYDPSREYIPRENRPEWSAIGMMGKLSLRKGQPVHPRWLKMRDISDEVEEWLVR